MRARLRIGPLALMAVALACVGLVFASAAAASSLVYISNNNVWLAKPDGSGQYQVTLDGTSSDPYTSASQANDGTIVAVHGAGAGAEITRMSQNGTVLNAPFTDASNPALAPAIANAVVSPDGSKVAYVGGLNFGDCIYLVCGPSSPTGVYQVSFADHYVAASTFLNGWSGTGLGTPNWLGNSRNLLFDNSGTVWFYDLGAPYSSGEPVQWFQEDNYEPQYYNTYSGVTWPGFQTGDAAGITFLEGAASADGTRLAVLIANTFSGQDEIALFSAAGDLATGNPPTLPTLDCFVYPPQGSTGTTGTPVNESASLFNTMSWSPDDSSLAYGYGGAIDVISDINLTNCTGTANQVLANGSHPSWGPANVNPGLRPCTGSGCNRPPKPPPPPRPAACATGGTVSVDRCLARLTYQRALTRCNQRYAGSGKSKRTSRAACRRRATVTYHRALAKINCSQHTNLHQRAVCLARARQGS